MNILAARQLTHIFPNGTEALKDINLAIRDGEFVIIAGSNGSGKTVLVRHFNGLFLPTSGEVLLEGVPISKNLTHARKNVGLIFQNSDSQIVGQTVAEDVAFGPENLNLPRQEVDDRVREALEAVGLSALADRQPHTLSGGQKRKLAAAGVLAMKPKVIIFDEPFTGLDYPGVLQILKQIVGLHKNGHTIILVTHELEKALAHADRLVILQKGRLVRDGDPNRLIDEVESYGIRRPYGRNGGIETMTWLS
ncbi:Putative ABC transporter [Acididesulfobacillus acetoxydans]|uniref:ABC transporter n=1 Tax=Acididesulfobacillus acetoxydans TaxID=1561005 RepID=A0A8S0Y261_9FIRM|nr:ABC transporter ATP-binding protein [Acididesulfobacillus acetoxydans]CAA7600355.1 Putative ABC transporter [Acididesulfobacillus acetoxydans]CEJ07877.1 Energy-coupling factor transporter ATP-binding protein EcfA [Acididesulfobacillus acetoxydans]